MTQMTLCRCMVCGLARDCAQMGKRYGRSICPDCLRKEEGRAR